MRMLWLTHSSSRGGKKAKKSSMFQGDSTIAHFCSASCIKAYAYLEVPPALHVQGDAIVWTGVLLVRRSSVHREMSSNDMSMGKDAPQSGLCILWRTLRKG